MPAPNTFSSLITLLKAYTETGDAIAEPTVFANIPLLINNAERRIARKLKIQGFERYVNSALTAGQFVYPKPDRWRDTISLNFGTAPTYNVVRRATATNVRTLTFDAPAAGLAIGNQVLVSGVGGTGYNGTFTLTVAGFQSVSYAAAGGNESVADVGGVVSNDSLFNSRNGLFPRSLEYCQVFWPDPTLRDVPRYYSDYGLNNVMVVPTPRQDYPFQWGYWQLPQLLDDANQTNYLTDQAPNLLLYSCLVEMIPFIKEDTRVQLWQAYYQQELEALTAEDVMKIRDRSATRVTS